MPIPIQIENTFIRLADALFERRPQPKAPDEKLKQCKIISHRGEHRDGQAKENTLAAFERAAQAGVWGIELDVRWTKDRVPVVSHDANMRRLYANGCEIARTTYPELKRRFPSIASLKEVVGHFGKRLHLMIEIKAQAGIDLGRQDHGLAETLRPLEPKLDYHLLALAPEILSPLALTPAGAKVAIGYYLPDSFSHWICRNQWGGLCGHYLSMRQGIVSRHQHHGQQVGTGFINSPNVLMRELNRGVDWIFSNNASRLQATIEGHLNRTS